MATFAQAPMSEEHRLAAVEPRRAYLRYLSILILLPIIGFLLALPLARTNLFVHMSRRIFWHAMEYHVQMAGQPCNVVIYGDSTGLTGIDPLILRQQTGLHACMLSTPYIALSTTGTWTLDHFLAASPAPRAIVFVYHPRHLRAPKLDEDSGIVDGWLMVDRVRRPVDALRFFLAHGRKTVIFMETVWQQVFTINYNVLDPTERTYRHNIDMLRAHSGYFQMKDPLPIEKVCEGGTEPMPPFDPDYFASLRKRYEKPGTRVIFYVSPVRSCDPAIPAYDALARRMGLEPPLVYPASEYADGNHLLPSAAPHDTADFAAMLRQRDPGLLQTAPR